jgi:NADPH-dependent curcumin reductase CurA
MVSEYNTRPYANQQLRTLLVNRIRLQGFIVSDQPQTWPHIIESLKAKVLNGELKYKECIAHGIESTPGAFIGMLKGENLGKQLVQLVKLAGSSSN